MNRYAVLFFVCISMHLLRGMESGLIPAHSNQRIMLYQNDNKTWYQNVQSYISRIAFESNQGVANIGCDFRITEEIAKKVPEGIVAEINVNEIKSTYKYHQAIAFGSLSWVKDKQKALKGISALLVDNGRLIAVVPHKDSAYLRARYKTSTHIRWKNFFDNYEVPYYPSNEDELRLLLQRAGLKYSRLEKGSARYNFKTKKEFIDLIRTFSIQTDRIPQELHEEFFNDIVTEYIAMVPQKDDGSILLYIPCISLVAEKVPLSTMFLSSGINS